MTDRTPAQRVASAKVRVAQAETDLRDAAHDVQKGKLAPSVLDDLKRSLAVAREQLVDAEAEASGTPLPRRRVTVEDALALVREHGGFRDADRGFAHASLARINVGVGIDDESKRRAHRLLADYQFELRAAGVAYDDVIAPDPGRTGTAPSHAKKPIGRTKVWVDEKGLWMQSPFAARDIVRSSIPSAVWNKKRVAYLLPATPAAALTIADALGQYGVDADEAATALVRQGHASKGAQAHRSATDLPPVPGSKTEAWGHQRQAFWFARELPGVLLDMEMGTGKSKVVVDLIHDSRAESVMIVCPERVVGVWPKQFGIHSGGEKHIIDPRRPNRNGEWNLLPIAKRVELYEHALHECDCGLPHVLMTNYAAAAHEPFKSWSLRQRLDYIAYDECHRIRSHSGVWSKWAEKMHPLAVRHIGGTGTLQAQTPLDVFGQARAVEPGVFGSTYIAFQKRYARMGGFDSKQFKGMDPDHVDEFAAKLASISYRAGEEVLDLPEMVPEVTVTSHLSPRARKAYQDLERDMYTEVRIAQENGADFTDEASVQNVLVRILRCQQITGGSLTLDSGDVEEIDTAKYELLVDELEDIPAHEPVVVFARFHHDLEKIKAAAAKHGRTYGELSGRRGDALAEDATLADGIQVAGVQIQAGGTGVDFTRSAFGIYYSVGHSLADYLQSRKRLHRPGQTRSVRFRHLVLEGTIDEDVYAALAARKKVTDYISDKVLKLQAAGRLP